MSTSRAELLLEEGPFLTEGGTQTELVYKHAQELPYFSTHMMLYNAESEALLTSVRRDFHKQAAAYGLSMLMDTETWRSSNGWLDKMQTKKDVRCSLHARSIKAAQLNAANLRTLSGGKSIGIVTGVIGPAGDAYEALDAATSVQTMRNYHRSQLREFKKLAAPVCIAYTFNSVTEPLAIALEAKEIGQPLIISFSIERNGLLASNNSLQEAIETIDREAEGACLFYMINCVHPSHIRKHLSGAQGEWLRRIRGVRANASAKTHEELDGADEIDEGDPVDFAKQLVELKDILPELIIFGGCCGTGARHCEEVAKLICCMKKPSDEHIRTNASGSVCKDEARKEVIL